MSGFDERRQAAEKWEFELRQLLNSWGWPSFPFGQAQLPDECRSRLRRFEDISGRPSLIRWMPDIITYRDLPDQKALVALIDAKACGGEYQNYSIEMSAIETAEIYTDRLYTPTFFVFDDHKVLTPREARQRGVKGRDVNNSGSGTPYLLVPKVFGKPLAQAFPPQRNHSFVEKPATTQQPKMTVREWAAEEQRVRKSAPLQPGQLPAQKLLF